MPSYQQAIPDKLLPHLSSECIIATAPGRINLIGEHTDYNNGWVLPAAISASAYLALSHDKHSDLISLRALDLDEQWSGDASFGRQPHGHWSNYILGVIDGFRRSGCNVEGLNIILTSEVPIGAGLSSSAAVECAVAVALDHYFNTGLAPLEIAKMAQAAEHNYAGVQCGLMDQFAAVFGKKGHAVLLDCGLEEYTYLPVKLSDYALILVNSMVQHQLAGTEYNLRRQQCRVGLDQVQKHFPEVIGWRDVDPTMLEEALKPIDDTIYKRCLYVIEENNRVHRACSALTASDVHALGRELYASHDGLSRLYAVSCDELDFLIDIVKTIPEVAGARMMGAGFGGCTINLVKKEAILKFKEEIAQKYFTKYATIPVFMEVQTGPGARVLA